MSDALEAVSLDSEGELLRGAVGADGPLGSVDGVVTEEPVRLINATVDSMAVQSYMFGHQPAAVDYECRAGN